MRAATLPTPRMTLLASARRFLASRRPALAAACAALAGAALLATGSAHAQRSGALDAGMGFQPPTIPSGWTHRP